MTDFDIAGARAHLERLLASEQLGRSETSRKLLNYLFERSLKEDTPKEAEIAFDVFGKGASFSGAEDSVVRVGVRTLRQKLLEYYSGPGAGDAVQFGIPKGGYRLTFNDTSQIPDANLPHGKVAEVREPAFAGRRIGIWATAVALVLLVLSLLANLHYWNVSRTAAADPATRRVRESPVWADMVGGVRPVTIVLGDLFMFTQTDPKTGHTLTVRDSDINSSEQLRAILADNPAIAAERGQRYVSMIQKSAAIGMAAVLRIVDTPGRRVEVEVRDDLQADDIRRNDIIYVGPIVGLGPLAGYYELRSRYRFDSAEFRLTDLDTHKVFIPEGTLAGQRMDYALFAKFQGPAGNHIMIFTSGLRNAGLLQNVRTLTSPEGLASLMAQVRARTGNRLPDSFEALIAVTGFGQTDLNSEIVEVSALPLVRQQPQADRAVPPPHS